MDVSVVIITYNQENYIRETLMSIINQDIDFSMEIIIGDDCSKDHTRDIINSIDQKYPGYIKKIFNKKNLGVIKNYFNAVRMAQGRYIMVCGGDDYWLPGKMKTQYDFMESHQDIGMCYGKVKVFDDHLSKMRKHIIGSPREKREELIFSNGVPACTSCFKRCLIEEYINDINPEARDWLMEDYPFWIWLSSHTKLAFIDQELAVYRYIKNSLSHQASLDKLERFENSIYEIQSFYSYQEEKEKLRKQHMSRLFNLYNRYGNRKKYQLLAIKESDLCNKIIGYIPLLFKIRQLLLIFMIRCNER